MAGMLDEMLNIHRIIAKCHLSLFLGRIKTVLKLFRCLGNTHALSAAAKRSLYDNRVADLCRDLCAFFRIIDRVFASRDNRNACVDHCISCLGFISETLDDLRFRSDKCNVALFTQLCKPAVLRKETESRMDSVCSGDQCRTDDILHVQIALRRRSRPDTHSLVSELCMESVAVRFRINCNSLNSHLSAGTDNTYSNFSAICDQYFSNHLLLTLLP